MKRKLKVIYENKDLLVVDKPPFLITTKTTKKKTIEKTLEELLLEEFPYLKQLGKQRRHGIIHRLDKETSGIVLVAKNKKAFDFFQKEFQERRVVKKYLALVVGKIQPKKEKIETLIGRDPKDRKKRKAFLLLGPETKKKGKRKGETFYRIIKQFFDGQNYFSLVEALPKTGRTHQIRVHLAFLGHPVIGDRLYRFKNQPNLPGIRRQFLHASYLKTKMPNGKIKEFRSEIPRDLKNILKNLKQLNL